MNNRPLNLLRLGHRVAVRGVVLGSLALPVAAQQDAPATTTPPTTAPAAPVASSTSTAKSGPPVLEARSLTVAYKRPVHGSARDLARALQSLYQRNYYMRSTDGTVSGLFSNIDSFGDLVVLHDTPEQVSVLTRTLDELDASLDASAATPANANIHVREYMPRHQSVNDMDRALSPLKRMMINESSGTGAAPIQVSNVTILPEPASLVLRDTEENLAEMLALLQRIDVPAPQVLVTCTLLRAVMPDDADQTPAGNLSPELLAGLRQLVPYQQFRQEGFAALRVSVVAGREFSLRGLFGDADSFQLLLRPTGFDGAAGLLSLDRCKFETHGGQQLETGLTLKLGEDTVLGASGVEPLFAVLRVAPLGG